MKCRRYFRNIKQTISAMILLIFVLGCAGSPFYAKTESAGVPVTVLFFNDLHGHLMPFEVKTDEGTKEVGGIARMASLIREIRRENAEKGAFTVVLVAGDILQGTPMSTVFKGKPDVACLNAMEVTAMAIGNHEFDFGLENLMVLEKQAAFPFLSANIIRKENTKRLFTPACRVIFSDRISLVVIGATTRELLTTTKAENVTEVDVLDSVAAVRDVHNRVKDLGPVILLSHSRHQTDREIAMALPDLSAIIGGHDQILLSPYRLVGQVPVFQAFEKGKYLGRIDLVLYPGQEKAELVSNDYISITSDIEPDPEIEKIVGSYYEKLDGKFRQVIGRSAVFLDGERERIRYEETSLGNFVTDLVRDYTGAQIALVNSGGLRASIQAGPVTVEDVFKAMPYSNEIVLLELTGEEVERALTRSVKSERGEEDGGFLQVSGLRFVVRGHGVQDIRVGMEETPMDPAGVYTVAVPLFLASGGDGYDLFSQKPAINTGLPLRELIVTAFGERGVVSSRVDGRIQRVE